MRHLQVRKQSMKKDKSQAPFLLELEKVPIVQIACEKTGVSRNSVYRWRKEDKEFSRKMDEALANGISFVNDMSESQLLSLIKDKSYQALSFWLRHRHDAYKTKVEVTGRITTVDELTEEQEKIVRKALSMVDYKHTETVHDNE